jgi:NAD(P)-dependent dehydrogenase (short-subunit alcohol dehydrogenase family)
MAVALAKAGADIALHANEQPASATAAEISQTIGRRTEVLTANLTDHSATDRLIADTVARFRRLDIL